MKNFINIITYFVLLYPLIMSVFWVFGGLAHKFRKKEIPEAETEMPIVIIIPIYNEESDIKKHIEHNLDLDYENYKIYAIDDQSTDNSAAEVQMIRNDKLKFFQNDVNMGKARTINNIVDQVDTDYFLVIDSDTMLDKNALKTINNAIQHDISEGNQDKVAAYTGNITVHADEKNKAFRMQKIEYRAFIDMIKRSQSFALNSIMTLSGACSVYNKQIFIEIGMFSEKNATEDINISWRFNLKDYKLSYIDNLYSSVTTPHNIFDLIIQRKRWTNGLLQTIHDYREDFLSFRNFNVKFYTMEIIISSIWAFSFLFVNLYYITILFTNYNDNLIILKFLFPTLLIFLFSTFLAFTSYFISDNERETKQELLRYYLLFPFAYFYVQPIGYVLGFVETARHATNEKWRRPINDHHRIIFSSFIDFVVTVVLLQFILEILFDSGFVFDAFSKFVYFLLFYIGLVAIYFAKLHFGEQCTSLRLKYLKNPAIYIVSVFIILRFLKAIAVFYGVIHPDNVYKLNILLFFAVTILSAIVFEFIYRINYSKIETNKLPE
ncbi:glycosyltransferase [Mollicutes bacterium LVI A0039]|nr:glycosyltransferase [Mollicutes bacterium LVI A0039]